MLSMEVVEKNHCRMVHIEISSLRRCKERQGHQSLMKKRWRNSSQVATTNFDFPPPVESVIYFMVIDNSNDVMFLQSIC